MEIEDRSIASQNVKTLFGEGTIGGLTDAELLERFKSDRDHTAEMAFRALLERHGPMVLRVCQARLRDAHDAQDAFQATFLVLVRRAGSLWVRDSLGPWLHQVAYRTSSCARTAAARRRQYELRAAEITPRPAHGWEADELGLLVQEEVARLPERYRQAVVLCLMENLTPEHAARHLNCPVGTVHSRLARGRSILAKRLARHGLASVTVAAVLADGAASGSMPCELVASTLAAARASAAEGAAANALLSSTVVTLTHGALRSMVLAKVNKAIAVLFVLGIAALAAGGMISRTLATEPVAGMPGAQDADEPSRAELRGRLVKLKQQLAQMQKSIARLEQATQTERNPREACETSFLADRFKYRVPFEIGRTQSTEGGRIEIREVWGTRPRIEIGGQYLVRGKYVLPPGERGMLYFYASARGPWGQTASLDLQSMALDKQEGEFALIHGMAGPGYFHLNLTAKDSYSRSFANVYFGTGDNVWREQH